VSQNKVFNCKVCGVCCQGEGGIYLDPEAVAGPAGLMGLSGDEFKAMYTEPKYGRLALKTDADGYCLLHDRENHSCVIHAFKPPMCRDWPFFHGILQNRQAFEDAKNACPGIRPDATWEDFIRFHRVSVGTMPVKSYISEENDG
jgi:uncharacterized protein